MNIHCAVAVRTLGFSPPLSQKKPYGVNKGENINCFTSSMPILRVNSYGEAFPWLDGRKQPCVCVCVYNPGIRLHRKREGLVGKRGEACGETMRIHLKLNH